MAHLPPLHVYISELTVQLKIPFLFSGRGAFVIPDVCITVLTLEPKVPFFFFFLVLSQLSSLTESLLRLTFYVVHLSFSFPKSFYGSIICNSNLEIYGRNSVV